MGGLILRILTVFLAMSAAIAVSTPVLAQSVYSKLDLNEMCEPLKEPKMGVDSGAWICEGYKNIPVYVAEGDLRFFVSFGDKAMQEPAASQSLGPRNRLGDTVEWVLEDGEPVATILRWHTDIPAELAGAEQADADGFYRGQVLVVTQLREGKTCHVGYVDARAAKNANKLARDAAHLLAGIWDCSSEPKLLGGGGLSLGLTK